jgi:uncharacterized protein (DUF1501 family)
MTRKTNDRAAQLAAATSVAAAPVAAARAPMIEAPAVEAPAIHRGMNRREVMKISAVGGATGVPFLTGLAGIGAAAAQTATDYKALVCVFLNGGNDNANTVIPVSPEGYAAYASARLGLSLPVANLLAVTPQDYTGIPVALSPSLPGVRALFEQGQAAVLANVGTLVTPVTGADWRARSKPLPFQLFSHSDQQSAWQTGLPDRPSRTGWLGRLGDLIAPRYNTPNGFSIAMSIAGNNIIETGEKTIQYQVTSRGPIKVYALYGGYSFYDPATSNALRRLMTQKRTHLLESSLVGITKRAIDTELQLTNALNSQPPFTTVFPRSSLGGQMSMVAKLIGINAWLGQRRQIFFVSAGGFDNHDNLLADHGARLSDLDGSLAALYAATAELGLANQVTSFTASDFGRPLQSNGRGSDHGWGAHHFIVGGGVRGRKVYGSFPDVAIGADLDIGQGRLIPTTSVDEYSATLARWFGVEDTNMATVIPNIRNFATPDLGFMN